MNISVASGKGGTGKTFLTVNLAHLMAKDGVRVLDCDVEEPDVHIFLKPTIELEREAYLLIPKVNEDVCIHCGKCSQVCEYKAITDLGTTVLVFPEMCHGCGACSLICPVKAIKEVKHPVGVIEVGKAGDIDYVAGRLNLKEVASSHLVREVKKYMKSDKISIVDAPPGTTCPTVASVSGTDFTILVTEPTPFGLNDLKLAYEMISELNIPTAVVINRYGIGDDSVENFCQSVGLEVLGKIPHSIEVAKLYSQGDIVVDHIPEIRKVFQEILTKVLRRLAV